MLEPRRLLTFREVAHQQSFSLAAAALSLTQPAVSQQIRALELQLGELLIVRSRTEFALTATGTVLLAHADAIFERLRLAETQLGEQREEERRRFRLGAFPSAMGTVVPDLVARLDARAGPLHVTAHQGETEELARGVRTGELHVALCFQDASLPRLEHDGTTRVDLADEPMLAGVGRTHRLATRRRIRLRELANDAWLAAFPDGLIVRACREAGFEPRLAYVTDDPLATNGIVSAGLAVTLVSELLAGSLPGVSTPELVGEPVRRSIYALLPPASPHPLADELLDAARSSFRR